MRGLFVFACVLVVGVFAYETDYRIGYEKLGGAAENLLTAPATNLSISETCDGVVKRKILFPTETTSKFNVVTLQSPEYYDLPPTVRVNSSDRVFAAGKYVGELELGDLISRTPSSIRFSIRNNDNISIPYDLGTKSFKLDKDCEYVLRNESIYKIQSDNLPKLQEEIEYQILQEAGLTGVLSADLQTILAKIGELTPVVETLRDDITLKEEELANLLLDKKAVADNLILLRNEILEKTPLLGDISLIRLDIERLIGEVESINNQIALIQEEIDMLINNYNVKMAELEGQIAILGAIIDNVATEEELKEVMSQVIVPAIMEKQKYSVEHLKGNVVPSKLIRIDE